jgi:hypothetical protein
LWGGLAPLRCAVHQDPPAKQLLYEIIGRLDEYDHGDWTDEQLRDKLLALPPSDLAGKGKQPA